ncbi:nuclear GTP-binding protein [Vigna unguiculata]|uniref:Nuclear GTP-binding protein n=1 Tax=Vigna unguiculata TaxID=3917 RepID=A0A4D6NEJ1_VIGUN|nr:nuclear GTP-binding protein [Vigna unguiculata]
MVMKSKKIKSKRVSLKKKYKVIRKVKEHNRKKAKEAKKLRLSGKNKVEKDPGIPNNWPFKEHELKALEARMTKAIEELEQKKAEHKERARRRKLGLLEEEYDSKLLEDSNKNTNDFDNAAKTREKKAKEAKKLRLSGNNKVEKDPGIPNNWPFKEQELKVVEARRTKAIEELEQKKVERKERARRRKLGLLEEEYDSKLLEDSNKNTNDLDNAAKTRGREHKMVMKSKSKKTQSLFFDINKKKAKEAKKLRLSGNNKVEKDPGIPNNWPFKEQELKVVEARRTKAIEEFEQKTAERKERACRRKLGLLEEEYDSKLLEDSNKDTNDFGNAAKTRGREHKMVTKIKKRKSKRVSLKKQHKVIRKEQELKALEARRTKAIEELEQKKVERKERLNE